MIRAASGRIGGITDFRRRAGAPAVSMAAAFVMTAVLITLISERLERRFGLQWDLTQNRVYSISKATKEALALLDKGLTIYTVYPAGNEDVTIGELLRRYEMASRQVKVKNIDPIRNPLFTQQFEGAGTIENNSIIVVKDGETSDYRVIKPQNLYEWNLKGDRLYAAGLAAEQRVTSAILSLAGGERRRVFFVEGHGEKTTRDLYYLSGLLENDDYLVCDYHLVYNNTMLEEGDLLLFASPRRDLTEEEAGILDNFLDSGGNAIFYIDIFAPELPNFSRILDEFGLNLKPELVVEADADFFINDSVILAPIINDHQATQMLREAGTVPVMPRCRSVNAASREGISNAPLFSTSPKSYGKTNPLSMSLEKETGDIDGPFILAAAAENISAKSRVVLFGSTDFISSLEAVRFAGNLAVFMGGISWAAGQSLTVAIEPKLMVNPPLDIQDARTIYSLAVALVGGLPALTLLAGFVVWRMRLAR
ncbi:MAG: GldG family protein [Synergistaceae bacterium]|jgi:hypothetical protein|nr:GldG family protein [Synergistaceae bacterium]